MGLHEDTHGTDESQTFTLTVDAGSHEIVPHTDTLGDRRKL